MQAFRPRADLVRAHEKIPQFFIYGEAPREADLRFVHVETISARGQLHHGEVRPHRHGRLHQLMLWTKGGGVCFIEDQALTFEAPAFALMPAGVAHGFSVGPASDALVVSVSDDFIREVIGPAEQTSPGLWLRPLMAPLSADEVAALDLQRQFDAIQREYRWAAFGRVEAISAHVKLLLLAAARLRLMRSTAAEPAGLQSQLFQRFNALLEAHYTEGWTVGRYAKALGSTPYLLNAAVREGQGCTCGGAIAARRLTEAKRLLLYSNRTVAEIAFDLGFSSPGYFCRAFQAQAGASPGAWRKQRAGH
ncbi:MAG: helix-turn-helix domain-containing protein [Caulobacteraceae bacterium]